MPIRDARTLEAVLEKPYAGYAVRQSPMIVPDLDRVVALVAVFGTMILSGIVLGRARS